ncbi:MAG TPA: dihydrolipoamide acetyltransferase family protein [Ktedonobacterales bacterium]|nr:dihydrolipoamide acetyltransferase family protein [Ktedonobacterales bacterium]
MHTVVMPKMGDTMEEGKVITWRKHEGDTIAKGDALAEIETEKVNIEAEAFAAGTLRKIIAPEGATVPVGQPIALIGDPAEPIPAEFGGAPAQAATATQAAQPTSAAPAAPATQAQRAQAAPQPTAAPVAVANGHIAQATTLAAAPSVTQSDGRVFISPLARHIAAEHNLDIHQIQGTGPGGRIIRDDVLSALQSGQAAVVAEPAASAATPPAGPEVEAVPLSQMRKTIAKRLQQSMQTAPHFYVTVTVDATRLMQTRAQINEYAATLAEPIKVSVNDLVVKAVATTLTRIPQVNVSFDGERILFKKRVNVGMAVALEQGLIVPVMRDADKRGLLDLARESRRLAEAARMGKLKADELQGGTFTVSNLGMYDVESFTAIINPPESAILAVGSIIPTPVATPDRQVVVRDQMKLTLSSDHRALDGAVAARFLQQLKQLLEQPMAMLI